jgi:transcriptional regulator with XRE-family HTH domain
MRTLDKVIADLPAERRAKVSARTKELIAEEMALRHLRQARDFTQQRMAELLRLDQGSISKIESRSDMLLSTLRSYVEAMGGSLRLIAEFPDGVAELKSLGEVLDSPAQTPKGRKRQRRVIALTPGPITARSAVRVTAT